MKRIIALLLACTMLLACAACGSGDKNKDKDKGTATKGGDINACIASEPETLDPNLEKSVDGAVYAHHMFEALMKYKSTGETVGTDSQLYDTEIVEGQAKSYTVSTNSDGQPVYTFTLRDDILWSDGQAVVAEDFVYSWTRLVDPATAATYGYILDGIVLNAAEIQAGEVDPSELGVVALDEKTVEITLVAECPYFLELCAFAALMPLRKDIIDQYGAEWTNPGNCVSNGAFVISEWVHDSYIKMVPNDKFYDAANISPDSITWWLNDSETAMISAYESGLYDFFYEAPVDRLKDLEASGDLFVAPYVGTYYLYLNCEVITDWRVRAAMTLSVDRDYLVENVTQGGQLAATGFVPGGISNSKNEDWAIAYENTMYAPLAKAYPDYDLTTYAGRCELAQDLYQEAVDEGAWDPNMTVTYTFNTAENHKLIAEAVQSDWTTVLGLSCTLTNQDWNVYTTGLAEGTFGIARLGWIADYNDAVTYLELVMNDNPYNYGRWVSDEYTSLMTQAKALPDGEERDALLVQAEELHFSAEGFTILPIYFYTRHYCRAESISNVEYTAFGYFFFHYASKG